MVVTPLPYSVRLQNAFAALIRAVGAYVMERLSPVIVDLQPQYEAALRGRVRFVSVLKLKAAIGLYHLGFKLAKRGEEIKLRLLGVDQLLLELDRKLVHLGWRYTGWTGSFDKLPDFLDDARAIADQVDSQLAGLQKSIKFHAHASKDAVQHETATSAPVQGESE